MTAETHDDPRGGDPTTDAGRVPSPAAPPGRPVEDRRWRRRRAVRVGDWVGGLLVFLWCAVLWLPRGLATSLVDDLLVLARLKWRPFTGDARWRWDRPRPDPAASAWQRYLRPTRRGGSP